MQQVPIPGLAQGEFRDLWGQGHQARVLSLAVSVGLVDRKGKVLLPTGDREELRVGKEGAGGRRSGRTSH